MAVEAGRQIRLLLWKDYLTRKRNLITVGGVLWALAFVMSLYAVRRNIDNEYVPTCQFAARALPSAGMLTFLQSFMCNLNNECSPMDKYEEIPTYENSKLTRIQRQFSSLIYNESVISVAEKFPDAISLLATVADVIDQPTFVKITKYGLTLGDLFVEPTIVAKKLETDLNIDYDVVMSLMNSSLSLQDIFKADIDRCSVESLTRFVRATNEEDLETLVMTICNKTDDEILKVFLNILSDIDFQKYVGMVGDMYFKLSGDTRVSSLGDTVTAAARMTTLHHFLPAEIVSLVDGEKSTFSYIHLDMITKIIDRFEPTFGNTTTYKAIREIAEYSIVGLRYLEKFITFTITQNDYRDLAKMAVKKFGSHMKSNEDQTDLPGDVDQLFDALQNVSDPKSLDVFTILPKLMSFSLNFVSESKRDIYLYATLLAKLMEMSTPLVSINARIEELTYNISLNHPEGVKVLLSLPPDLVGKGLEGLSDPDRTMILTNNFNDSEAIFCNSRTLQSFFGVPEKQATSLKEKLCNKAWTEYIDDLVKHFGIQNAQDTINEIVSIFVQETLNQDSSNSWYTIDQDFEAFKNLVNALKAVDRKKKRQVDWNKLFNKTEHPEIVEVIQEKSHLGKQILVVVHGSLAKEVITRKLVLFYKISPTLRSATAMTIAINKQLEAIPMVTVNGLKSMYPDILRTLLSTALDEDKTYKSLSRPMTDIMCNGDEYAAHFVSFPPTISESGRLVELLCSASKEINKITTQKSYVGRAMKRINEKQLSGSINWSLLINELKRLYVNLDTNFTYILEFDSYGMDEQTQTSLEDTFNEVKDMWFGKKHMGRTVHLSFKLALRLLDVIDQDIFHVSDPTWLRIKSLLSIATGPLQVMSQFLKLTSEVLNGDPVTSQLPSQTVAALNKLLPAIPALMKDVADIIADDSTDVDRVKSVMSANPDWPCSTTSLASILPLSPASQDGMQALETIICLDYSMRKEWLDYIDDNNIGIDSFELKNGTAASYRPNTFLQLSSALDDIVKYRAVLHDVIKKENSTITSWEYILNKLNVSENKDIFRKFLFKVDDIMNSTTITGDTALPLNSLWEQYAQCLKSPIVDNDCLQLSRNTWFSSVKFISVLASNAISDIYTYMTEVNEPGSNLLQLLGFTQNTGLYELYSKLGDLIVVLINSYWDYGFMSQIRQASLTEFWDCEALIYSLVPPPGSRINMDDIQRMKRYVCPSLLHWVGLPRGENNMLNLVAKPNYLFFTLEASNLTSNYETTFSKILDLRDLIEEMINKSADNNKDNYANIVIRKLKNGINELTNFNLKEDNADYILFYKIFKTRIMTEIYLTRIVAIVNKLAEEAAKLNIDDLNHNISDEISNKLQIDIDKFKKMFKSKPIDVIALHFDVLTQIIWNNDESYQLVDAFSSECDNFNNSHTENDILIRNQRLKAQICNGDFKTIYGRLQNITFEDVKEARSTLLNLVEFLNEDVNKNIYSIAEFFNIRKVLVQSLKTSISYSLDLGLPIYLKYLQSNVEQYNIVISLLSGQDWWKLSREMYNGPESRRFLDNIEKSVDIIEDVMENVDKIHLMRLLRDVNFNSSDSFCHENVTISDYIPDHTGTLADFTKQSCTTNKTDLFKEIPPLTFASQVYDTGVKLSKHINYTSLHTVLSETELKLQLIKDGPKSPKRPAWITEEKIENLKQYMSKRLQDKQFNTKLFFGTISNVIDGVAWNINNSQCTYCSTATIWAKQLSLQLVKKQDYDTLMCRLDKMPMDDLYLVLQTEFHWDMAFRELILTRNYTKIELNKALNEFMEQVKLHYLDDIKLPTTKIADCLINNVSRNEFGNATLVTVVTANVLKMLRAQVPHLKNIEGMKNINALEDLASHISGRLDIDVPLNKYLKRSINEDLKKIIRSDDIIQSIENSRVNLRKISSNRFTIDDIALTKFEWQDVCTVYDCDKIFYIIKSNLNRALVVDDLPKLQKEEFWSFNFISRILNHMERIMMLLSRILGIASKMDVDAVMEGKMTAMLDFLMQILTNENVDILNKSLEGLVEELRPALQDTQLEYDLRAITTGLTTIHAFKSYLLQQDLKVEVSKLFPKPDEMEASLSKLGVNRTDFWSVAAPKLHAGYIDLKPIFSANEEPYHIKDFVCNSDQMSKILLPAVTDEVVAEDVYDAVIDQFCNVTEDQTKKLLPNLMKNIKFGFILEKVSRVLFLKLYSAANLTEEQGDAVIENYPEMMAIVPVVQKAVGNVSESLIKDPMFQQLKNFQSVGNLMSSSEFLSSAGNMLCGRPFAGNSNRFIKAIASSKDFSSEPDPEQLQRLPNDFCRNLYKDILHMNGGKIVWSFAKPLVMGQILYTPTTPAVERIIAKANGTFATLSKLVSFMNSFANSFSSVDRLSKHREGLRALQKLGEWGPLQAMQGDMLGDVDMNVDVDSLFDELKDVKDLDGLLRKASNLLSCINLDRFHGVPSEIDLTRRAVDLTRNNEFSAGLVFLKVEEKDEVLTNVEYKIRMDIESVPTTARTRNQFWTPGPEGNFIQDMRYFRGFIQIQDMIDKAIIDISHNSTLRRHKREVDEEQQKFDWGVYTQQIPYPCYMNDYFQSTLYESQSIIVVFFFALLYTVASAVRFIVADKESGNTMLMSVMGVNLNCYTLSWFVASVCECCVTVAVVLVVLVVGRVLPRSQPGLLLLLLLAFVYSVLMFCYMMSKLFNSASFAAVCAAIAYLMTYLPFVFVVTMEALLSLPYKLLICLFMSSSFSYSYMFVTRLEAMGEGAQWSDLWHSPDGDGMTMGLALLMMVIDGFIYFGIGYLIDMFYGIKATRNNIKHSTTTNEKAGVSIVNVTKVYGRGRKAKVALDNVSIEMHKGQITTLLGHNGAGKTTLVKILTGMMSPTQGDVTYRVEAGAGPRVGVCPQRDVLHEHLSAREHLALYAQLQSGCQLDQCRHHVDSILSVLSLAGQCDVPVRCLSGGTRRRVCVALAFVARPALVSLDEPTAAVDPAARREIWSMIMKLKKDRTVLLTTHHLDEAELLSDQIVIMHKGQIHTTGSPMDIKRSLGTGYKLSVTYDSESEGDAETTKALVEVVRSVVHNAELVDTIGNDVEIQLPFYDASGVSNNYQELCKTLETCQDQLRFKSYTMDCSSLEQIFYNICQRADEPDLETAPAVSYDIKEDDSEVTRSASSLSSKDTAPLVPDDSPLKGTTREQFLALLYARYKHYSRNSWLLLVVAVLPAVFVCASMACAAIRPPPDAEHALLLHPTLYQPNTNFIINKPHVEPSGISVNPGLAERVMKEVMAGYNIHHWSPKDNPTCNCTASRQVCEIDEDYNRNPADMLVLPDADTLNQWLVASQLPYIEKRYGGFSSSLKNNASHLVAWYNNRGHHALPSYVSALHGALLRAATGQPAANITTYTHPLKISKEQLSKSTIIQYVADAGITAILMVAYSLVNAGSAIYLVGTRQRQEKRLQLLCGVPPLLYWTTALVWDLGIVLFDIVVSACIFLAFGFPVFVMGHNLLAISLLTLLYGFAGCSVVYVLEKCFREASLANMVLFCISVFSGACGIGILLILDIISESETTDFARLVLHHIFMVMPSFSFIDGLIELAKNTIQAIVLSRFGMDTYKNPLTEGVIMPHCLSLLVVGSAMFLLNLAIECDWFAWLIVRFSSKQVPAHGEPEASDVYEEQKRVSANIAHAEEPLRLQTIHNINSAYSNTEMSKECMEMSPAYGVHDVAACVNLSKVYTVLGGQKVAVNNVTLGFPPGECTALLGQNGAGKSTIFAMLTGEERPTGGAIYLQQKKVTSKSLRTGLISYCPQSDAIDPLMTVTETLELYCRLRGIRNREEVISNALSMFELRRHGAARGAALSGGSRRKLCAALAFMSRAPLVLLDEPTSGMDVVSSWCVVRGAASARARGRSVLVSTHALQHARALGARVALLSRARLAALAPLDACLHRFGGGYVVSCRVSGEGARARPAADAWAACRRAAPPASLQALSHHTLQFLVPAIANVNGKEVRTPLSEIFRMMAELQTQCEIEDFIINQSSLDQMFLSFTERTDTSIDLDALSLPEHNGKSTDLHTITAL